MWQLQATSCSFSTKLPTLVFFGTDSELNLTLVCSGSSCLRRLRSEQTSLNCAHRVLFAKCIQFFLPATVRQSSSTSPSSAAGPSAPNSEELPGL